MGAFPSQAQASVSGQRKGMGDLVNAFQRLQATLVGGSVTISAGIVITAASNIQITRNTIGGTVGDLTCPDSTRVVGGDGTGEIVINSDNGADTSVLDVVIIG